MANIIIVLQDGTYAEIDGAVVIDTSAWSAEDFDRLNNAADNERSEVAMTIAYDNESGGALITERENSRLIFRVAAVDGPDVRFDVLDKVYPWGALGAR